MNQYIRHLAHAAAIAAALTGGVAPAAETRGALYGDVRMSLDYTDDRTAVPGPAYTVTDNQSIWGLKFSAARGGVTVFGGYERFIDADDPPVGFPIELTRQAYLGMTSPCGTVKLGRHATAYSEAGRKLDPFYNTAVSGTSGVATAGSLFGGGNSHGTSTAFNGEVAASKAVQKPKNGPNENAAKTRSAGVMPTALKKWIHDSTIQAQLSVVSNQRIGWPVEPLV
jgi:hypothetical protein